AHPAPLDAAARELEEYFAGRRRSFDLPLDLRLTRGFRRQVVEQLPTIAYGSTASYAELARRAGSARAMRAVGSACATNPLPVVLPCHRVLRADGSIGGYRGGPEAKRMLLALEAGRSVGACSAVGGCDLQADRRAAPLAPPAQPGDQQEEPDLGTVLRGQCGGGGGAIGVRHDACAGLPGRTCGLSVEVRRGQL